MNNNDKPPQKEHAFKVHTTDMTIEKQKREIQVLLDESLETLTTEIKKLKRKIKLNSLNSEELDAIYAELKANAPKKED